MQEHIITTLEAGQRLDKYLHRLLPDAQNSFLYKMLRKKNITLNGKKAAGNELLAERDAVRLFLSDETYVKMGGRLTAAGECSRREPSKEAGTKTETKTAYNLLQKRFPQLRILYEDAHIAAAYKPAGVLSQKAQPEDLSLNEWFLGLLFSRGELSEETLRHFTPSVQNRLDRNTEGIVLLAKTLPGSHLLTGLQREHLLDKYYHMIVAGRIQEAGTIEGYLAKDEKSNTVQIHQTPGEGRVYAKTEYRPLKAGRQELTLVEARLITGRTHQLRAHLAGIGHPILGDPKYGSPAYNQALRGYGIRAQLLLCQRVEFPKDPAALAPFGREDLAGTVISCREPEIYETLLTGNVKRKN